MCLSQRVAPSQGTSSRKLANSKEAARVPTGRASSTSASGSVSPAAKGCGPAIRGSIEGAARRGAAHEARGAASRDGVEAGGNVGAGARTREAEETAGAQSGRHLGLRHGQLRGGRMPKTKLGHALSALEADQCATTLLFQHIFWELWASRRLICAGQANSTNTPGKSGMRSSLRFWWISSVGGFAIVVVSSRWVD